MSSQTGIDDHYNEDLVQKYRLSMSETHESCENQTLSWRLQQLNTLEKMLIDNEEELVEALFADLHKDPTESRISELCNLRNEIRFVKKNLSQWMKPKPKPSPTLMLPFYTEVRPMPLCSPACLIIAPFNYPVLLSLLPAVGALAGGNPVILKPSELCPSVATLLEHLVNSYFEQEVFRVINGGVQTTTGLLKQSWGLIFFTGSERVGKIVAKAAAETLTPTALELGGKSPVYLDKGFSATEFKVAVDRIIGTKTMNAGQTCIAPDYLLCHESEIERFRSECQNSIKSMFGENIEESGLARIVSRTHAKRLLEDLEEAEKIDASDILYGGSQSCNIEKKFIMPTIVLFDSPDLKCSLLQNEIFGPILPVIPVKSEDEAIEIINKKRGTPLALYVLTNSKDCYEKFIRKCPAANYAQNDLVLFYLVDAPFGGKGSSGYGEFRGKASFRTFTKGVVSYSHPCSPFCEAGGMRYPPFVGTKKFLPSMMLHIPNYFPVIDISKWIVVLIVILSLLYMPIFEMLPKPIVNSVANHLSEWSNYLKTLP